MGKNVHYGSSSFEFQKMRLINWFGSWSKMLLATTATVVAAAVFGFQYAAGLIVAPLLHSRAKKRFFPAQSRIRVGEQPLGQR
jgi:hypothetical protein